MTLATRLTRLEAKAQLNERLVLCDSQGKPLKCCEKEKTLIPERFRGTLIKVIIPEWWTPVQCDHDGKSLYDTVS